MLKVGRVGQVCLQGRSLFVGGGLAGERVALRPTATATATATDGVFKVVLIHKIVRKIDLRQRMP
ncbi:hypothetical protein SA496_10770 [Pseudomonas sp. JS3066]|uniref:hypothetical protein n=1 Tax=Pseudomonas sp. JS3066 TaxID=3090665 RepID=UPI002E7B193D|nr:hypothetical protein [Pseudomonas sp. JS3066]WVK95619.1 hypothetical protein SA496_10770 [Pseudomonas sp. JS3066]